MNREHRQAALRAGGEIPQRSPHRIGRDPEDDSAVDSLEEGLRRQREWMLRSRPLFVQGEDVAGTRLAIRERVRLEAGVRPNGAWLIWPSRGWAVATACTVCAVGILVLGIVSLRGVRLSPPIASLEAPSFPAPPAPKGVAVQASRPMAPRRIRTEPGKKAPELETQAVAAKAGAVPGADPGDSLFTATVIERIDEVVPRADGSARVRLRTSNPLVRVYLITASEISNDEAPWPDGHQVIGDAE